MQYVIGAGIFLSGIVVGVAIYKTTLNDLLDIATIDDKDDES